MFKKLERLEKHTAQGCNMDDVFTAPNESDVHECPHCNDSFSTLATLKAHVELLHDHLLAVPDLEQPALEDGDVQVIGSGAEDNDVGPMVPSDELLAKKDEKALKLYMCPDCQHSSDR